MYLSPCYFLVVVSYIGLPRWLSGKESACQTEDVGLTPGLGRILGETCGYLLKHFSLENPVNRGAWWAAVHGVTKSQTQLSH